MPRGIYDRAKAKKPKRTPAEPKADRDALIYLSHVEREIIHKIRNGKAKRIPQADLLALLALAALRGE